MYARCSAAALLFLTALAVPVLAAAPKNVLIVRGESSDLPGGSTLVEAIESSIHKASTSPIEFYVETVDTGRFASATYEDRLSALLADKYGDIHLDLVVAFGQPAVQFVIRERPSLFPNAPLLLGLIDPAMISVTAMPPGTSAVYVQVDAPAGIRFAQRLYPAARRVLVASGASRFDRGWERIVREQLRDANLGMPIAYDSNSSLEDLSRRVSQLPPDTIVLYLSMTRDGADQPERPIDALETLRAASAVPLFGLSSTYLGHGIVGGSMVDFTRHGEDLARHAVRMLAGETPAPVTTAARLAVDARELERFHIADAQVPAAAAVLFREPTLWEEEKTTITVAAVVVLGQTVLIVALVRTNTRRRRSERDVLGRLRFERQLSEFSVSLGTMSPGEISAHLEAALAPVAAALDIDWAWRWRPGDALDAAWDSPLLHVGESHRCADAASMPPSLLQRLRHAGTSGASAFAVPLMIGGVQRGAIFWISRRVVDWAAHADELRIVGTVVSAILQRKQAQLALESSNDLKTAILDSLPAQVAVLDREGAIIAVNHTWLSFARDNGVTRLAAVSPGASYFAACLDGISAGSEEAQSAYALVAQACAGESAAQLVEYRCDAPGDERWFEMSAEPLRRPEGGAVVTHWDISRRRQQELALRESEHRFLGMSEALPIMIWMSDAEGACTYVNSQWLDATGRTLAEECGEGWLDSIHANDRAACADEFIRAFRARQPFRMEYRLRRHDGEYRWMADSGVPRYTTDGVFQGYVGGCIDVTDTKAAEQMLRDLTHRLMHAQDDERRRIARELHDHLSQQLALLAIDLQHLSIEPPASVDACVPALQEAWRRTTEIASDVHAISHRLHPSKMESLGLVATARAHCREVSKQSVTVQFHDQSVPPGIPPERALSLFRVLEEALSNVVRHSGARAAHVELGGVDGQLLLRVGDDGRGFVADTRSSGLGLVSMRERVESLDGTLSIRSTPGRGTVVEVLVPVYAADTMPGGRLPMRAESA